MHAVGKIGVIAPPITHALIVDALDGIDRTARAAGYDVVVFTCSTNPKQPYSKVRDPFYIHHISGEKEIYDLAVRADLDGYIILADYFLIRNLWESFYGSSISGAQDAWCWKRRISCTPMCMQNSGRSFTGSQSI